ncbi:hypothetical protein DFH09DRAFT_1097406 [Mycena vulgaris]|nr:hypothetical protein DFH09DRAFT_1097406 [Mycena vulgaris]
MLPRKLSAAFLALASSLHLALFPSLSPSTSLFDISSSATASIDETPSPRPFRPLRANTPTCVPSLTTTFPPRLDDIPPRLDRLGSAGMLECRHSLVATEGSLWPVVHCRCAVRESSALRGTQRKPCRGGGRLNACK